MRQSHLPRLDGLLNSKLALRRNVTAAVQAGLLGSLEPGKTLIPIPFLPPTLPLFLLCLWGVPECNTQVHPSPWCHWTLAPSWEHLSTSFSFCLLFFSFLFLSFLFFSFFFVCVFISLFVWLFVCPFLSFCLSFFLSCLSVFLSLFISFFLSCVSFFLSVCLSVFLSFCRSFVRSFFLSFLPSFFLSFSLSLSLSLSFSLSFFLSVFLSFCLSFFLSFPLSFFLSVCLSFFLSFCFSLSLSLFIFLFFPLPSCLGVPGHFRHSWKPFSSSLGVSLDACVVAGNTFVSFLFLFFSSLLSSLPTPPSLAHGVLT